jgi:hypothetical protein
MKFELTVETHDRSLGFDFSPDGKLLKAGSTTEVPGGATVEYEGTHIYKSLGIPEVLQFLVDASVNVDLALLGAWLYDKVKNKPVEKITFNRRVITEITAERIRQVIEEEVRRDDK